MSPTNNHQATGGGSSAIKRIHRELQEILQDTAKSDQSALYWAKPLEENLFEWHFTLKGPPETDYEQGLYHGIILLPPEYPFKPPWVIFKTPNGRFELNRKICLSITAYHPEEWNPSWGIRTVLLAIISHFPTEDKSSIGYLDYTSEERRALAKKSREFTCPHCGPILQAIEGEKAIEKAESEMVNASKPPCENSRLSKKNSSFYLLLAVLVTVFSLWWYATACE
jgi:ubiquitin-conjugating enzyme E2 J1